MAFGAERTLGTQGHSSDPNCREAEARSSPGGQLSCEPEVDASGWEGAEGAEGADRASGAAPGGS